MYNNVFIKYKDKNKCMDLQYFPYFVKAIFPTIDTITSEEMSEMGTEFKSHLERLFIGEEDKLQDFWCIDLWKIIAESNSSLRIKGYHPALVQHFINFVRLNTEEEPS